MTRTAVLALSPSLSLSQSIFLTTLESSNMFKTTNTTSIASTSPSLFSRIKAKFARVRVGRSAKVVADLVFVPETVSCVIILTEATHKY
jgi:hypothetical protein